MIGFRECVFHIVIIFTITRPFNPIKCAVGCDVAWLYQYPFYQNLNVAGWGNLVCPLPPFHPADKLGMIFHSIWHLWSNFPKCFNRLQLFLCGCHFWNKYVKTLKIPFPLFAYVALPNQPIEPSFAFSLPRKILSKQIFWNNLFHLIKEIENREINRENWVL